MPSKPIPTVRRAKWHRPEDKWQVWCRRDRGLVEPDYYGIRLSYPTKPWIIPDGYDKGTAGFEQNFYESRTGTPANRGPKTKTIPTQEQHITSLRRIVDAPKRKKA